MVNLSPNMSGDADMVVESLERTENDLRVRDFNPAKQPFPDRFVLQTDGGSENWNKFVMSYALYKVLSGQIRYWEHGRNMTGHSHNKCDQMHSIGQQGLKVADCYEIADQQRVIKEAHRKGAYSVRCMMIARSRAWKSILGPGGSICGRKIVGMAGIRAYVVVAVPGGASLFWREHWSDPVWKGGNFLVGPSSSNGSGRGSAS